MVSRLRNIHYKAARLCSLVAVLGLLSGVSHGDQKSGTEQGKTIITHAISLHDQPKYPENFKHF